MKRVIQFTRPRFIMISLSILLIAGGFVVGFLRGGFNYGIDFSAGMTLTVRIERSAAEASIGAVREALAPLGQFDLQEVGGTADQRYIIKVRAAEDTAEFQQQMDQRIRGLLAGVFGAQNIEVLQSDFVGARYSRDLATQTVSITIVALVLILIYTAFRFKFVYGVAAILCLVHDALFMTAVILAFQLEFTTTTIAAILTIIGYSLNDTIVIFDRVRENQGLMRDSDLETVFNTSITQTISRTLLTSLTTLFAVGAIYVFGTGEIKDFAFNLVIGIVAGTYSTVFIASPIVLDWTRAIERRRRASDLKKFGRGVAYDRSTGKAAPAATRPVSTGPETDTTAARGPAAGSGPQAGTDSEKPEKPAPEERPDSGRASEREAHGAGAVTRIQPSRKKKKKKK